MKIEIEKVDNGYLLVLPKQEDDEYDMERKFVIQALEEDDRDETSSIEFKAFADLVEMLQDIFYISNSKHNKIGFIAGLCSEDKRWDIHQLMEESLENPKNDLGDE